MSKTKYKYRDTLPMKIEVKVHPEIDPKTNIFTGHNFVVTRAWFGDTYFRGSFVHVRDNKDDEAWREAIEKAICNTANDLFTHLPHAPATPDPA